MFAKLTALVGGGYTFPYNLEEQYERSWGQWTHHRGTHKDDGTPVSVFRISAPDTGDRKLVAARNGVRRLRMLRHPNLLAFKDSAETQEKGQTVVYLVTAPVRPLKLVLEELDLKGQHRDEYLAMGILHMTNAVSFLNNDCKLIHGNICLDAVVVTETLDWKLYGFDLLSEQAMPAEHCLTHASWMVGSQYKPAELGKSEWDVISQSPPWAVDAWGLGCLMQEVFTGQYLSSLENLRRTEAIPPALLGDYQKLLSSAPNRRLNPAKVAESKFLNNRLVDVVAFMENISVKDSMDKESFFKKMVHIVPVIPPAVATHKILPLLSHALEFGGAPPHAVGPLLLIGNSLSSEEFNKRVVPTLSKLFASPDRTVRRSLLESLDTYCQHLTTQVLEDQIYPQLQTGFTDGNAYIRELTLKSILTLAPKLSNKTLVNNVLKHLSKLQVDEEPSIRANTTVLLGNIAKYLGEGTCKRVLLNAFTRALKDNFPPAKIAGLRAMVATSQYHGPEDAALRIIPAVAPMTIEPVSEVRSSSLQVLEVFTKVLKDADDRRAKEALNMDGGIHSSASSSGIGNAGAAPSQVAGTSMLTWAVSSLMSTTGLAVKSAASAPPATSTTGASPTAAATAATAAKPAAAKVAAQPALTKPAQGTRQGSASSSPAPSSLGPKRVDSPQDSKQEGWGDGDGWDQDEELLPVDDEEAKARARLSALSTGSSAARAAQSRAPLQAASSAKSDGWDTLEEGDGQDDGTGSAAPVKRTAPAQRVRPGGSAAGTAKPKSGGGGMKLGAQKLGAQKLGPTGDAFFGDADGW